MARSEHAFHIVKCDHCGTEHRYEVDEDGDPKEDVPEPVGWTIIEVTKLKLRGYSPERILRHEICGSCTNLVANEVPFPAEVPEE
jgi:hypothetical protein